MHVSRSAWALALIAAFAMIPAAGASPVVILQPPTAETATPPLPDPATSTAALAELPDPVSIASEKAAAAAARIAALLQNHPELAPDVRNELNAVLEELEGARRLIDRATEPVRPIVNECRMYGIADEPTCLTAMRGRATSTAQVVQQRLEHCLDSDLGCVDPASTAREHADGAARFLDDTVGATEDAPVRGWSAFARWFGFGR